MTLSNVPPPHDALVPLIAALLGAERRIAMLERRLRDARWLGPTEEPNPHDKEIARRRVSEAIESLGTTFDFDDF